MDEERRVESDPEDTAPALKTFLREIKPCHRSSTPAMTSKTHGVLAVGNLSILKKAAFGGVFYHDDLFSYSVQCHPAITKCHGTGKIVRYSGVSVIAKTPLY